MYIYIDIGIYIYIKSSNLSSNRFLETMRHTLPLYIVPRHSIIDFVCFSVASSFPSPARQRQLNHLDVMITIKYLLEISAESEN